MGMVCGKVCLGKKSMFEVTKIRVCFESTLTFACCAYV